MALGGGEVREEEKRGKVGRWDPKTPEASVRARNLFLRLVIDGGLRSVLDKRWRTRRNHVRWIPTSGGSLPYTSPRAGDRAPTARARVELHCPEFNGAKVQLQRGWCRPVRHSRAYSDSESDSSASSSHLMNGPAALRTLLLMSFETYYRSHALARLTASNEETEAHLLTRVGAPVFDNFLLKDVGLVERHEDLGEVGLDELRVRLANSKISSPLLTNSAK